MIGRGGRKGSGIFVPMARQDDVEKETQESRDGHLILWYCHSATRHFSSTLCLIFMKTTITFNRNREKSQK